MAYEFSDDILMLVCAPTIQIFYLEFLSEFHTVLEFYIKFMNENVPPSHCFVSSNSFHGQITQKAVHQLSDPENKKFLEQTSNPATFVQERP